jgi:hypothetical protein
MEQSIEVIYIVTTTAIFTTEFSKFIAVELTYNVSSPLFAIVTFASGCPPLLPNASIAYEILRKFL